MTTGPETKLRVSKPHSAPRVVKWEALIPWMQSITRQLVTRIGIRGSLTVQQTLDSIDFEVPGGTGATGGLDVTADGRVTASTILGAVPKIGGTPITGDYTPLTIDPGDTTHVIITVTGTPVTTTLAGRVFFHPAMNDITVAISATGTLPDPSGLVSADGAFVFLLATFVDGAKALQAGHGPVGGFVQDQLDGSGNGQLQITYAGP